MPDPDDDAADGEPEPKKKSALRELAILAVIAVLLYYVMLTFVARPYLIPSESMEPTLHGCTGCVGDRIMVDKLTYRFSLRPEARFHDGSKLTAQDVAFSLNTLKEKAIPPGLEDGVWDV